MNIMVLCDIHKCYLDLFRLGVSTVGSCDKIQARHVRYSDTTDIFPIVKSCEITVINIVKSI